MACAGGSEKRTPVGYRHLQGQTAQLRVILRKSIDSYAGFRDLRADSTVISRKTTEPCECADQRTASGN